MTGFGTTEAEHLLATAFAPWIIDLGLKPQAFDETGGDFLLPANPRLVHVGGVICGQATASAADTVAVITLISAAAVSADPSENASANATMMTAFNG